MEVPLGATPRAVLAKGQLLVALVLHHWFPTPHHEAWEVEAPLEATPQAVMPLEGQRPVLAALVFPLD